jgi:3-isopropylmalate/(R)-2-methylmalate dehydratase small subunit
LDIQAKTIAFGEQKIAVDLPETYRSALTSGSWDSTALLRANLSEVKKTAAKLPYINNFAG